MFELGEDSCSCSASRSTAKSHREIWSSDPLTANILDSVGCHSIEVMGAMCHLKVATGVDKVLSKPDADRMSLKLRRSQVLKLPSSAPDASK